MSKVYAVVDIKAQNLRVEDTLPKMNTIDPESITRSYSVVIARGQAMGLLLALTYPIAGTVLQWRDSGGVTQ